ncbi:MAG: rhomboid family intramembrane serine protease [Xenococcaceae cyanobacterium MO_188.B32]|nr:rhomboid family intramembrane serine protease [Xenococcaceae cyanobacterium MO_188.B32]
MVPFKDNNPTQTTPVIVYTLITINIVLFFHELSLGAKSSSLFDVFALIPQQLTASLAGNPPNRVIPEIYTLITSQFLHGGLIHISGNMLFLWIFGDNVEESLGHIKFLVFYLGCGVLAALTHWFFAMDSTIPTVGASGAIAGIMGAYLIKYPQSKIIIFPFVTEKMPAFFFLGFWFFYQAFKGVAALGLPETTSGAAYWAHAGGFIFGAILAPMLGLFRDRNSPGKNN